MTPMAAAATTPEPAAVAAPSAGAFDTFPKMLLAHARLRPDQPAMREKDYGIWQSWSWAEAAVRQLISVVDGAGSR
jgi:hypothetical protein